MPATGSPPGWTGPDRDCSRCGTAFTPRHPSARYCTHRCRRKAGKTSSTRSSDSRHRLYERDGWICYLCLGAIDPEVKEGGMRASLDHVIPLSDPTGPGNVHSNIRSAHHGCNSRKGNKPLTDALLAYLRAGAALRAEIQQGYRDDDPDLRAHLDEAS